MKIFSKVLSREGRWETTLSKPSPSTLSQLQVPNRDFSCPIIPNANPAHKTLDLFLCLHLESVCHISMDCQNIKNRAVTPLSPQEMWGIGCLDIKYYYLACQLTRLADWNLHTCTKAWVTLEQFFSHPHSPLAPLDFHLNTPSRPEKPLVHLPLDLPVIYVNFFNSWPRLNPDFPPGTYSCFLKNAWPSEKDLAEQFFHEGSFRDLLFQSEMTLRVHLHNGCISKKGITWMIPAVGIISADR